MRKLAPLIFVIFAIQANAESRVSGELVKWHPINIDVTGPMAAEADNSPNPFMDIRLDITLTNPSGEQLTVPGFFAGNGAGNGEGNVWRARFAANESGAWQYQVAFYQGVNAAVVENPTSLATLPSHGDNGEFTIAARDAAAPGFLSKGRLEYVGEHYLKFADGPYFIKSGVDSPENFFGYGGFDNTVDQPGGVSKKQLNNELHEYAPHIQDYQTGDPNFISEDTGVDGKGIIGAINYLNTQGVNSVYFLPMNLGGDGRDTYPFISPAGTDNDNVHYDVSKLNQWDIVLNHMQRKGVAAQFVLNEQEDLNTNWLDDGELGPQRKLFYRELISRFSYLNAVKWNISEESRHGADNHIAFARYIRKLDWAEHPLGVHSFKDSPERTYTDLLGLSEFDITSIQFSAAKSGEFTESWRTQSSDAGWPWVIDMDELGPGNVGLIPSNIEEMRKSVLYPVYFSGGNIEWYFGGGHPQPLGGDTSAEDFRQREAMYGFTRIAREFMEANLPFWQMIPNDTALGGKQTNDQVFSKAGEVYALYLENGEAGRELSVAEGSYAISWYDPRRGEDVSAIREVDGSMISIGEAPKEPAEDWVVLVRALNFELPVVEVIDEPEIVVTPEVEVDPEVGTANPDEPSTTAVNETTAPELGAANGTTGSGGGGSIAWYFLLMVVLGAKLRYLQAQRD